MEEPHGSLSPPGLTLEALAWELHDTTLSIAIEQLQIALATLMAEQERREERRG